MPDASSCGSAALDARSLTRALAGYRTPHTGRSLFELAVTLLPLLGLAIGMMAAVERGHWWSLVFVFPAAGLLVRLFIIQHDCGHRSYFRSRRANDWLGRALGALTVTPYDDWRQDHAIHHRTSGNLDHRGIGDIDTLTVEEYRSRSRWGRLGYRLYRHPLVMFAIGPAYQFLLRHRIPASLDRGGPEVWLGVLLTNVAIAALVWGGISTFGAVPFLAVYLPIVTLAASMGVWLFYVQHQFEEAYWDRDNDWSAQAAALEGSSHYDLPAVLRWFSGNIGIHHVHHLASSIPFYRLPEVLRDFPQLADMGRLTLRESLESLPLVLWDAEDRRLISFREARRMRAGRRGLRDAA